MLCINRKAGEKIFIWDSALGDGKENRIELWILEVDRNRVRFGINAPKHIKIDPNAHDAKTENPTDGPRETAPES